MFIGASCWVYHDRLSAKVKAGVTSGAAAEQAKIVLPVCFTLSSALLGGSQMIVQSKGWHTGKAFKRLLLYLYL